MKPNDLFLFIKNNRVSQDTSSLVQCYLPIIGQEALSLYLYTITFLGWWAKRSISFPILNHLNFGMPTLLQSFKVLSALDLLTLYQKGKLMNCSFILPSPVKNF